MKSIRVTKKAFKKVASIMENTMKKLIKSQLNPSMAKFRSGALVRDLQVTTKEDPNKGTFSFFVNFPFYGQFFDSGVAGSRKPVRGRVPKGKFASPNQKSFYQMGKFKGKSIGTQTQPTGLPFPLNTNIAYFGLQPKPFINAGIEEGMDKALETVGPDLAGQITKAIKNIKPVTVG